MTSFKILSLNNQELKVHLDEPLNIERIKTMYSNDLSDVKGNIVIEDPRKFSERQRKLFFALLKDIHLWSGQDKSYLKEYFYDLYCEKTYGEEISLKNQSQNTVSEVNTLIEIVIEFVFKFNIPINKAARLLPRNEAYYLFLCCKYRMCMECGSKADIHHVDALGMGSNRTKAQHLKHHFMALCRTHHVEIEQIGRPAFAYKYHLPVDGIKLNETTLKLLNIQGDYTNDK
ncbi:putative HNHc nuclease [Latilactobacillus curvatus]|uniref:putative HNHc nuclease n=1 Tax=Latilactobacillus curvatus TaxID=28038 RepID=UPI000FECDCB7|nr:putative HNHc nuclease [Latilactobacillus curvatus]QAR35241.1 hypothetical protein EQK21_03915 [Latilactobacillus curvatus]